MHVSGITTSPWLHCHRVTPPGARDSLACSLSWRSTMIRKLMMIAALLLVPGLLAAQGVPNANASDTAKSKVLQRRASRVRGEATGTEHRPVKPAAPAGAATRASRPETHAV